MLELERSSLESGKGQKGGVVHRKMVQQSVHLFFTFAPRGENDCQAVGSLLVRSDGAQLHLHQAQSYT
jgi:hypothetical protein